MILLLDDASNAAVTTPLKPFLDTAASGSWAALLVILLLIFVIFYHFRFRKYREQYSGLKNRLDDYAGRMEQGAETGVTPGHYYVIASHGPVVSPEAEFQSADNRRRHLSAAFPNLAQIGRYDEKPKRELFLVSTPYTDLESVASMQMMVGNQVKTIARNDDRQCHELAWVKSMKKGEFDALRHPQIAIANPAIYTFPFFLTWQRRHQWGVLPYATHTRLGIVVHPGHDKLKDLQTAQDRYMRDVQRTTKDNASLWINNPAHLSWLDDLLEVLTDECDITPRAAGDGLYEGMTHSKVYSFGAYLHKELLPLSTSLVPGAEAPAKYTRFAQEVDLAELTSGRFFQKDVFDLWGAGSGAAKNSAAIVDLALIDDLKQLDGWHVFRLPHCVYVPIGIGYSVSAAPLLSKAVRHDLVSHAGEALIEEKDALHSIGIEIDKRLWTVS